MKYTYSDPPTLNPASTKGQGVRTIGGGSRVNDLGCVRSLAFGSLLAAGALGQDSRIVGLGFGV